MNQLTQKCFIKSKSKKDAHWQKKLLEITVIYVELFSSDGHWSERITSCFLC